MSEEPSQGFQDKLKSLCPLVDQVRLMLGAARHGFNRHSLAELEEIVRMRNDFTLAIDPFFTEVEAKLKKAPEAERPYAVKFQGVISELELMTDAIGKLEEPIRRKGNQGTILSDEDFFHVNDLFSRLTGLLRALVDILQQNDPALKAYVINECRKLKDECFQDRAEHGTRMIDSPGRPASFAIYLAILERFREAVGHLEEIVTGLD
jgi:Na+/phosphate symporter